MLDVLEKEATRRSSTYTQDRPNQKPSKPETIWDLAADLSGMKRGWEKTDYSGSAHEKIDQLAEKASLIGSKSWEKKHPFVTGAATQWGASKAGLPFGEFSKKMASGQVRNVPEDYLDKHVYNLGRGTGALAKDAENVMIALGLGKAGAQSAKRDISTQASIGLAESMAKSAGAKPHQFPRGMFNRPVLSSSQKQAVGLLSDYFLSQEPIYKNTRDMVTMDDSGDMGFKEVEIPAVKLKPKNLADILFRPRVGYRYYKPGRTTSKEILDPQARSQMKEGLKNWEKLTPKQQQKAKAYGIEKGYFKDKRFNMLNPISTYLFGSEGEDYPDLVGVDENQLGGFLNDLGPLGKEMYIAPHLTKGQQKMTALHEEGHGRQNQDAETPAVKKLWAKILGELTEPIMISWRGEDVAPNRNPNSFGPESYHAKPTEVSTRLRQLDRYFNQKNITPTEELIMNPKQNMINELDQDQRDAWYDLMKSKTIRKDYLDFLHGIVSVEDKERNIAV